MMQATSAETTPLLQAETSETLLTLDSQVHCRVKNNYQGLAWFSFLQWMHQLSQAFVTTTQKGMQMY